MKGVNVTTNECWEHLCKQRSQRKEATVYDFPTGVKLSTEWLQKGVRVAK